MNIYKLLIFNLLLLLWIGCTEEDIAFMPINQLTTDEIINSPELLEDATQGNYACFRGVHPIGGNSYDKNRYDCKEYMSDDVIMMRWSGNHLSYTLTYQPTPYSQRSLKLWQQSYIAIYGANVVIEAIESFDNITDELKQLKGENIWIRAMFHFDLVTVFGRPYSHDNPSTNLGVPIISDTRNTEGVSRASVKETFEFIEQDLLTAASLMNKGRPNIYASKEVAFATLARLYLYKGQYEKAIEYADKVINSNRYHLVDSETFPTFNELGPERNPETIFAVKFTPNENRSRASIGGMMNGDGGWGEIMASSTYLDLLFKNKNDLRIEFITPDFALDGDGNKIPDPDEPYYGFKINNRMGVTSYWQKKLTYEYGYPMLHSPIYFRLAEMYLIKAEAFAKTGQDQKALDMVNIIRNRTGLSGDQLFRLDNMQGYNSILDIVLDEKRLEFAWEAHRSYDVFRNKRTMDRSYLGWQGWSGPSFIPYTSNRILHSIPQDEITLNPNLKQNPSWQE